MSASLRIHRVPDPAERAAQLEADERSYRARVRSRFLARVLGCAGSSAAGIYLIGLSLHMTDQRLAWVAFWSGLLVGNCGIAVTLALAYLSAEEVGDA